MTIFQTKKCWTLTWSKMRVVGELINFLVFLNGLSFLLFYYIFLWERKCLIHTFTAVLGFLCFGSNYWNHSLATEWIDCFLWVIMIGSSASPSPVVHFCQSLLIEPLFYIKEVPGFLFVSRFADSWHFISCSDQCWPIWRSVWSQFPAHLGEDG